MHVFVCVCVCVCVHFKCYHLVCSLWIVLIHESCHERSCSQNESSRAIVLTCSPRMHAIASTSLVALNMPTLRVNGPWLRHVPNTFQKYNFMLFYSVFLDVCISTR